MLCLQYLICYFWHTFWYQFLVIIKVLIPIYRQNNHLFYKWGNLWLATLSPYLVPILVMIKVLIPICRMKRHLLYDGENLVIGNIVLFLSTPCSLKEGTLSHWGPIWHETRGNILNQCWYRTIYGIMIMLYRQQDILFSVTIK